MSTAGAYGGKKRKGLTYDPDAWATPQWLFDELNAEFRFRTDVAASHDNAKCDGYYNRETDALSVEWAGGGPCFCNPPYSEVERWLEKAHFEATNHGVLTVCLVKADTSTKWWHRWWRLADEVRFLKRIQFVPPPGYTGKVGGPNMGHALLIFGKVKP